MVGEKAFALAGGHRQPAHFIAGFTAVISDVTVNDHLGKVARTNTHAALAAETREGFGVRPEAAAVLV